MDYINIEDFNKDQIEKQNRLFEEKNRIIENLNKNIDESKQKVNASSIDFSDPDAFEVFMNSGSTLTFG